MILIIRIITLYCWVSWDNILSEFRHINKAIQSWTGEYASKQTLMVSCLYSVLWYFVSYLLRGYNVEAMYRRHIVTLCLRCGKNNVKKYWKGSFIFSAIAEIWNSIVKKVTQDGPSYYYYCFNCRDMQSNNKTKKRHSRWPKF